MTEPILDICNLSTSFFREGAEVKAVNRISYSVHAKECVAIIGESGSGKSVSALSLLRLIPYPPGIIKGGSVMFKGRDLLTLRNDEMEKIRGNQISMIFQEPGTALNPLMTIGNQITENILLHTDMSAAEARSAAVDLLERLEIPNADMRVGEYPYQFSGGMQQRAMIAMAMSCKPDILIADEPTTALDVTVQAQVLEHLNRLRTDYGTALILITHNLGIVARYADTVIIIYAGRIVEQGPVDEIFEAPAHPYTVGLIKAVPRLDLPRAAGLFTIEGEPPRMDAIPDDRCAFLPRCSRSAEVCGTALPELEDVGAGHCCACHFAGGKRRTSG
jgi:oligopeptide transport system ATP-binding protein